ncbi:Mycobacterium rhizamassiliense ORFan [Mycobacterium rhizamassiliense]|jgi:hypothetical protein|uniref:Mycobacterium rhizamassiliense ORFan n=1 Tax=Mycobacterium rhizamassiliense TaxID=1841860 RepID=A0A2U3NX88_9MYCO|nr:Mycobacterium rhizamassiliense ORFan [Mycobacterium rhizamassiliense]
MGEGGHTDPTKMPGHGLANLQTGPAGAWHSRRIAKLFSVGIGSGVNARCNHYEKVGGNETQSTDCFRNHRRRTWRGCTWHGRRLRKRRARITASGTGRWAQRAGRHPRPDRAQRPRRSGWTWRSWPGWARWPRRPERTRSGRTRWSSPGRTRWAWRSRRTRTPRWPGMAGRPGRSRWTGWSRRPLARRRTAWLLPRCPVGRRAWPLGLWRTAASGLGSAAPAAWRAMELRPDRLLRLPGDARLESCV